MQAPCNAGNARDMATKQLTVTMRKSTNYARANLLESHVYDRYSDSDDFTPSTLEAQVYAAGIHAAGGRTGPVQRAPRNRTAWTPEGIQAARDARANRGNAAASGSGAGPMPAGAPRASAPEPRNPVPEPPAGRYNARESSRSVSRAVDVFSHLEQTPMKITYIWYLSQGGPKLL